MRKLLLGFSTPKHITFPIVSWMIRLLMKRPYSHIYGRWFSKKHTEWNTFHSTGAAGVHMIGNPEYQRTINPVRVYMLELEDHEMSSIIKFAIHNNGKKYAHSQNLGIWWSIVWGLKKNPFSNGEELQNCSELWGRILAGKGIVFDKSFDLITPGDIEDALIKLGTKRVK